jgi:hypothetical protein
VSGHGLLVLKNLKGRIDPPAVPEDLYELQREQSQKMRKKGRRNQQKKCAVSYLHLRESTCISSVCAKR